MNTATVILTDTEQAELTRCEALIEQSQARIGEALQSIKNGKLWRVEYPSFEGYIKQKWGFSLKRAYQFIKWYELEQKTGLQLANEAQARALAKASPEALSTIVDILKGMDKVNNKIISLLIEVVETAIATGTVETQEGDQLRLNQITAIQTAVLLSQVETHKRQLEHINSARKPIAQFSRGIALDYIPAQFRGVLNLESDTIIESVDVFKTSNGFTLRGVIGSK